MPRSGARKCLHDRPVGGDIGCKVDFELCGVDQRDADMLKVFGRCVMDGRRGIGSWVWSCLSGGSYCYYSKTFPASEIAAAIDGLQADLNRLLAIVTLEQEC